MELRQFAKLVLETERFRKLEYDPKKIKPGVWNSGYSFTYHQAAIAACVSLGIEPEWGYIAYLIMYVARNDALEWADAILEERGNARPTTQA